MNTNSNMSGIGYIMVRRAMALNRALSQYPFPRSDDERSMVDKVALVVTHEEYRQLIDDPELWKSHYQDMGPMDSPVAELRLCGILVLPR